MNEFKEATDVGADFLHQYGIHLDPDDREKLRAIVNGLSYNKQDAIDLAKGFAITKAKRSIVKTLRKACQMDALNLFEKFLSLASKL